MTERRNDRKTERQKDRQGKSSIAPTFSKRGYNYYARFQSHSYHCCKEMKFIPRLDVNFLDNANCGRTDGRKVEPLYRTLLKAGAIKIYLITKSEF